jgi:DNA invertase Pin-like site-specific DNA recombinase
MSKQIFGYARVSTKEQNLDRQIEELKKYVEHERNIITDKASGKNFERDGYKSLKTFAREGDEIYIKSLDRLGRNKDQIKDELKEFKDRGIIVRVLDVPTTLINLCQFGDMQKAIFDMINNILIEVLGTIAEQERNTTHARQTEGIAIAKAKGKHLGRPKAEIPKNFDLYYTQWKNGEITAVKAMDLLGLKRTTFYKLVKEFEGSR